MQHRSSKCLCLTFDPQQIWREWAHSLNLSHITPLVFLLFSISLHTDRYKLVWEQTHKAKTLAVVKMKFKGFKHQLIFYCFSAQGISPCEGGISKEAQRGYFTVYKLQFSVVSRNNILALYMLMLQL